MKHRSGERGKDFLVKNKHRHILYANPLLFSQGSISAEFWQAETVSLYIPMDVGFNPMQAALLLCGPASTRPAITAASFLPLT